MTTTTSGSRASCATCPPPRPTPWRTAWRRRARRRRMWHGRPLGLRWVDWSAHNSITRAAWTRLDHGFDPRFVHGQDSEFGYRLSRSGASIVVDPALEIEHRGAPPTATNRAPRACVAGASRALFDSVHGDVHDDAPSPAHGRLPRVWDTGTRGYGRAPGAVDSRRAPGRHCRARDPAATASSSGRVVAFCVESAGRAGRRHGSTDRSTYRRQNVRHVRQERPNPGRPWAV